MPDILFLTLKTFSATGGIEKVCKVAGKALFEYGAENNKSIAISSMYDTPENAAENPYFPNECFLGFRVKKIRFIANSMKKGRKAKLVILSHINLLPAGVLIKKVSPRTRVMLLAHGIEIWDKLNSTRTSMLKTCDKILSVSSFTQDVISQTHGLLKERCAVLNNCLDPFLTLPANTVVESTLRARYGFTAGNKILFTLSRLSAKERYKGYEVVLEAMALLKEKNPEIRYMIAGSYDEDEKLRLDEMIRSLGLEGMVVIPGFLPEEEIPQHFKMADLYVMPSRKEGFGIVFIEAMYYGLPVIAGNEDGSSDALLNGELGKLVNPNSVDDLKTSIEEMLGASERFVPNREKLLEAFSYESYKEKFGGYINELIN